MAHPHIHRILLLLALLLMGHRPAMADVADRPLADSTLDPRIHSANIAPTGWEIAPPIITLGQGESLTLTFDYLGDTPPSYTYRLVHCDRHWRSSGLLPSAYLSGYETNPLPYPQSSVATQPSYFHYQLRLPNPDAQPTLSGNYLIQVLDPADGEKVVLQRRFALVEPLVRIRARATHADGAISRTHQRVEAQIDYAPLGPFVSPRTLHLIARQNWYGGCPQELEVSRYIGTTVLHYGGVGKGLFPGNNEWRMLDLQRLYGNLQDQQAVHHTDGQSHVELATDKPLSPLHHLRQDDLNGYPAIGYVGDWRTLHARKGSGRQSPRESDYAWVYFALNGVLTHLRDTVYLQIGGLHDQPGLPMRYSRQRQQYEASVQLKQGVYSYRYLLANGLTPPCERSCSTEACFATTENTYNLLLYYRPPTATYDRLVGHTLLGDAP